MANFEKINDVIKCKLILEDNSEFIIPMREDGYIHATALCKAANKQIGGWLRLKETKELRNKLEKSEMRINISQLIEVYKGNSGKYSQGTWIHSDLGIQLAQWCSPNFALQVSKWIRELLITDKVELGKEKSNDEIKEEFEKIKKQLEEKVLLIKDLENKNKEYKSDLENKTKEYKSDLENKTKEYNFLQNKVNRFQKRENFPDKNVIYIITCDELEKDRIYIFGKAVDLKHRLTSYNKSLEHKVIYYKGFKNMYQMRTAELMLLYKLDKYKNINKDRFILPKDKDISFFTNVVDEIYHWFENIENIVIDNKEPDKDDVSNQDQILPKKRVKNDKNRVYLLTSEIHLKNRTYIIGKSKNLNSRLTAYNKGIDHTVEYNKKCNNVCQMNVIELMILYKLDNFRERMNRDRFILPEDKDISFFTKVFDTAVNWFNDIDSTLEIIKDGETKKQEYKDRKKVYREENKEKKADTDKKYREENKEELLLKKKIYRDTHKKEISETKKNWYKNNKEKTIDRVKKNYENNKLKKLEKVKEYSLKNKEKIKQQQSNKITCECGVTLRKYGLKKHLQTLIHIQNLEKIK
jgi:hypothetical protein